MATTGCANHLTLIKNCVSFITTSGCGEKSVHLRPTYLAVVAIRPQHMTCTLPFPSTSLWIWAKKPIHSFLVGCLNPCLQRTSVRVGSPQPSLRQLDNLRICMVTHFLKPNNQCLGRFSGIIGQDPSVSKSNHLHVDIFRLFLVKWGYIL